MNILVPKVVNCWFCHQKIYVKNCHAEDIIFKSEVNFKNSVLTAPAKVNAPVKFTSLDKIKLTLIKIKLRLN